MENQPVTPASLGAIFEHVAQGSSAEPAETLVPSYWPNKPFSGRWGGTNARQAQLLR